MVELEETSERKRDRANQKKKLGEVDREPKGMWMVHERKEEEGKGQEVDTEKKE